MQMLAIKQRITKESVMGEIATKLDSAAFATWIAPLQVKISEKSLDFIAQNQFTADYIKKEYGNILQDVALGFSLIANICARNMDCSVVSANDNIVCEYKPSKQQITKFDFKNFIPCDENMFTIAACKKIANGDSSFDQLFIHGASGSGKTLLLDCICGVTNMHVVRMTGGQFVSDFARSLRDKTVFSFKDFCRNCDLFVMDDVCSLSGKRASMDEFYQLIMDLRSNGKKVVLTANGTPGSLVGFEKRMQSLFASGLVVDVVAPNAKVCRSWLLHSGVDIAVADELSKKIPCNGHVVNGIINKIKTYTDLMGERVNMDVASHLLGDVLNKTKTPLSMVKMMCEKMSISFDEICGNSRTRRLVRARQIMMAVLKSVTNLSLSEIGNVCGGRDHATVVYALGQVEKQKASDLILGSEIDEMVKMCK